MNEVLRILPKLSKNLQQWITSAQLMQGGDPFHDDGLLTKRAWKMGAYQSVLTLADSDSNKHSNVTHFQQKCIDLFLTCISANSTSVLVDPIARSRSLQSSVPIWQQKDPLDFLNVVTGEIRGNIKSGARAWGDFSPFSTTVRADRSLQLLGRLIVVGFLMASSSYTPTQPPIWWWWRRRRRPRSDYQD